MNVQEILGKLAKEEKFLAWQREHQDSYIVHFFFNEGITIGFYNKDDSITSFQFQGEELTISPPEEILKRDKEPLPRLCQDLIVIEFEDACRAAEELQSENYPHQAPIKTMGVLQSLGKEQVYNLSLITSSFQVLNVKVNSATRSIVSHELVSLMDMGQLQKGMRK